MFDFPLYRPDGKPYYALWFHIALLVVLIVYSFYTHFKNRNKNDRF